MFPDDQWALSGTWSAGSAALTARQRAAIRLNSGPPTSTWTSADPGTITATVSGRTRSYAVSGAPDVYALVRRSAPERATIQVTLSPGLAAYSFTLG